MDENPYVSPAEDGAAKSEAIMELPKGCLLALGIFFGVWCLMGFMIAISRFFAASSAPN